MAFLKFHGMASVTTPIPASISTESILKSVRDHYGLAMHSPMVSNVKRIETNSIMTAKYREMLSEIDKSNESEDDNPNTETFDTLEIEETVPLYGKFKHICGFRDLPDGLRTIVCAPLGVWLGIRLKVTGDGRAGSESQRVASQGRSGVHNEEKSERDLVEETVIEANMLLLLYIKYNWAKAHRHIQASLLKELEEKGQDVLRH